MNAILASDCARGLEARDFRVHMPRILPPNDGGLCLGQLAIAHHRGRS
jgi:hydrogenase maturation protein HypF